MPIKTPPLLKTRSHRCRIKKTSRMEMWLKLLLVQCGVALMVILYVGTSHVPFFKVGRASIRRTTSSPSNVTTTVRHTKEQPLEYGEDGTDRPARTSPSNVISVRHPCKGFSRPPPSSNSTKRTGPRSCDVCYVPVDQAVEYMPATPSESPKVKNLTYYHSKNTIRKNVLPNGVELVGSDFGGYHSLTLRNISYDMQKSMIVPCGFVPGKRPGQNTGFDINYADILEMEKCRGIVVVSAIFGNFDVLQQPKNVSETSKKNVCFYMFVDEETERATKIANKIDKNAKNIGLWRLVVVKNLPYVDHRRTGKIPKLLSHRLFPSARYSIWVDGKLQLVVDPYQILERFLWRENVTFAISKHYARFDVFIEAEHNKAAGKYDNASIDSQVAFYKSEGLTPFSPAKHPIISDVPEGCVIIREHIPIANLFTCLWFNEVDRFTSRDQISFSTVRDKIKSQVDWSINMFQDCERRNFVLQSHHKDLLEKGKLLSEVREPRPPPAVVPKESPATEKPAITEATGRGRDEGIGLRARPRAVHKGSTTTGKPATPQAMEHEKYERISLGTRPRVAPKESNAMGKPAITQATKRGKVERIGLSTRNPKVQKSTTRRHGATKR